MDCIFCFKVNNHTTSTIHRIYCTILIFNYIFIWCLYPSIRLEETTYQVYKQGGGNFYDSTKKINEVGKLQKGLLSTKQC